MGSFDANAGTMAIAVDDLTSVPGARGGASSEEVRRRYLLRRFWSKEGSLSAWIFSLAALAVIRLGRIAAQEVQRCRSPGDGALRRRGQA